MGSDTHRDADFRRLVHGKLPGSELEQMAAGATRTVDATGTFCPEPVIRTQKAARELSAGDVLLLIADDAGIEVDIPAWCISTGHEFLGLLRDRRRYRALVRISRSGT